MVGINKVYLSGRMTGVENHNFPAFHEATRKLRNMGFTVFNPAETDNGDTSQSWEYYMKIDVQEVAKSDAVVVLPGWEDSRGAREEVKLADLLKIPVFSYPDYRKLEFPTLYMVPKQTKDTGAIKHDASKLRMDLIPMSAIVGLAEVLTFGANKYNDRNWEKGFPWSRVYSALLRHLFAWFSGETNDKETGYNHLFHVLCNTAFLIEFATTHPELDDRPVGNNK